MCDFSIWFSYKIPFVSIYVTAYRHLVITIKSTRVHKTIDGDKYQISYYFIFISCMGPTFFILAFLLNSIKKTKLWQKKPSTRMKSAHEWNENLSHIERHSKVEKKTCSGKMRQFKYFFFLCTYFICLLSFRWKIPSKKHEKKKSNHDHKRLKTVLSLDKLFMHIKIIESFIEWRVRGEKKKTESLNSINI